MPASPEIRLVPEDHLERMLALHDLAFHVRSEGACRERHLGTVGAAERIGAYDGDDLVGMLAAVRTPLSLPGGDLPCAVVTFVAVAPSHRRRGLLSAMLELLWSRCAEQGVRLAALWAAEAVIYPRYGFGAANRIQIVELASDPPLDLRVDPDPSPVRPIDVDAADPAGAAAVLGPIHERARRRRPGQLARDARMWSDYVLCDHSHDDPDAGPPRVVVLGEAGEETGYALYRVGWGDGGAVVKLEELEADTPRGEAALWRYLASIDLTRRVRCRRRPVDDALGLLVVDADRVTAELTVPWLWLRLVDVPAAVTARGWAAEAELVVELRDPALPGNAGRWQLQLGPDGAGAERTSASPELTLDTRDLAAAYLGGSPVAGLVRAGLAEERAPGAAAAFDAALATPLAPFTVDCF